MTMAEKEHSHYAPIDLSATLLNSLTLDATLESLPLQRFTISIDETGRTLAELFDTQATLPGVILLEDGRYTGAIARHDFLDRLSHPYSIELFYKRSLRVLCKFLRTNMLLLSVDTKIVEANRLSLQRPPEALPEPLVIKDSNAKHHLLDVQHLLIAHSHIQLHTSRLLEEQRQAAESANIAKSQFITNMSHELRTPLNAIIGFGDLLLDEAKTDGHNSFIEGLEEIINAGQHLLGLINEVLDISKLEAGKMELFQEEFDIHEMLEGVLTMTRPLIEKQENHFHVQLDESLGSMHNDLTKVRQILINLLGNASKFTERGDIFLTVQRIVESSAELLHMEIRDTGIGMSETQQQRLFQAFSQADASTTRKYGGTGLGLAISKRFAEMMGGNITIDSAPGQGSTFTVVLPIDTDSGNDTVTNVQSLPITQAETEGACVLVIDDEKQARELLHSHLSKLGYKTALAHSGEEGLAIARKIKPGVILLDILMPHMDGWKVLAALKADRELARIPVVLVSLLDDKNQGFALGANDYILKPVDREQLRQIVSKYCKIEEHPRAMIVEDDWAGGHMLKILLEREKWEVVLAENGRIALDQLNAHPVDLILLDLMMPEMDGFEFLEKLREQPAYFDTPVIVVTAKDITTKDHQRLESHVSQVFHKPSYQRTDLMNEVQNLLSKHF